MTQTDQLKLIRAGFIIIRRDKTPNLRIKVKDATRREWSTYEKGFPSEAALDRRMKELLKGSLFIED